MCDHTAHREAATLTVRVIKSFDYGTLKCIAVRGEHGINLDTCTVRQLKDIITARTWPLAWLTGALISFAEIHATPELTRFRSPVSGACLTMLLKVTQRCSQCLSYV